MRKILISFMTTCLCLPTWSSAANFFASAETQSQLVLYVQMNLGERHQGLSSPSFGLSLNRELSAKAEAFDGLPRDPFAVRTTPLDLRPTVPVLDFRLNLQSQPQMLFGGMKVTGSDSESIWHNPWLYVGIAAGVLAISCMADNFPCDSGDMHMGGGGGGY